MVHARRKIEVTTRATTNWKGQLRHYGAKTESYDYPKDDVSQTKAALAAGAKAYKEWLRALDPKKGGLTDQREMMYLALDQNHRIVTR